MRRVGEVMQGKKCFREKVALSVLGHAGEDLGTNPFISLAYPVERTSFYRYNEHAAWTTSHDLSC